MRVDLPSWTAGTKLGAMWDEPYLETCCRSALHRLVLCGATGRPGEQKDGPCLRRLAGMGLARERPDRRFEITEAGRARHAQEVLKT
jgi:hypothetical protein